MALIPQLAVTSDDLVYTMDLGAAPATGVGRQYDPLPYASSTLDHSFARPIGPATGREAPEFVPDYIGVKQYDDVQKEVRGTVLDSAGNPMQRVVAVVSRSGQFIASKRSEADGTFKIITWDNLDRVAIIAIPDEGDVRNAQVKWGVMPVTKL